MAHDTDTEPLPRLEGKFLRRVVKAVRVKPGESAAILTRDTGDSSFIGAAGDNEKQVAAQVLAQAVQELEEAQTLLYADGSRALLVVLQAMDAAGKDSTIKHVLSGVNPQGIHVTSFKQPSDEELEHDFLWRMNKALPARGSIGVFNRSHYEDVVTVRVHPEWLEKQKILTASIGPRFWKKRLEDINAWEHHLDRSGTKLLKFFLNVSQKEQRQRFIARLERPDKHWKFNPDDLEERKSWDAYMQAYEDAITATSTKWAPWHIIPADGKHVMQAAVAGVIVEAMRSLDLHWTELPPAKMAQIEEAKRTLSAEVTEGSLR